MNVQPLAGIAIVVILIVCVIVMAIIVRNASAIHSVKLGGVARSRQKSPHVVVDTLNLTHWMHTTSDKRANITTKTIIKTIEETAPAIRAQYPGRIMYVVKDRESVLNDPDMRVAYAEAATAHNVYIYVVERYEEPPNSSTKAATHSSRGRDDLYMAILARRWKCSVLTEDRFRDFDKFREEVEPFHVYEFAFWRTLPEREYVRPDALLGLKRPPSIRYESLVRRPSPKKRKNH